MIDDDDSVRQLLLLMLTKGGYYAEGAESGEEALESAACVQVALVDMIMPGMGGLEVIEAMRWRNPALGVIATSGCEERLFRPELDRLGVVHFLRKPFTIERLFEMVQGELSRVDRFSFPL